MSAGFWKRNEKVVMTLFLLILAPTFAATGAIFFYFGEGQVLRSDAVQMYGETMTVQDWRLAQKELRDISQVQMQRLNGPFFRQNSVMNIESYLMLRGLADELGVQIGETQKQRVLRDAAVDILQWYRIVTRPDFETMDQVALQAAYMAELENEVFNPDEYRAALRSGKVGPTITVEDFEASVLALARLNEISQIVNGMAVAPEVSVYNEYVNRNQKRGLDFVEVPSSRFDEQASVVVDDVFLRDYYEANRAKYRRDAAVRLVVAKADRQQFEDPDYQPTVDEIQARYDADKATKYKMPRPAGWEPPEDYDPEVDDYRPLVDVLVAVEKSLKDEYAEKTEREVLNAALTKAAGLRDAGTEFTLEELFPEEERSRILFDEIDWFTRMDAFRMDAAYRNDAEWRSIFNEPSPDRVGEMSLVPVQTNTGMYIYQIAGIEEPRDKTFDEAIADITRDAERQKARDLTEEFLAAAVAQIRDGETTLEDWAASENYTVQSADEPVARVGGQLKVDGRNIPFGFFVVQALFAETTEPGDITDPVVPGNGVNLYLAKLTEIVPPTMDQWLTQSVGLENTVLNNRQMALRDNFQSRLEQVADVRYPVAPDSEGEGSGEGS